MTQIVVHQIKRVFKMNRVGIQGPPGPQGEIPDGVPSITVGSTPPLNPQVNDVWIQTQP